MLTEVDAESGNAEDEEAECTTPRTDLTEWHAELREKAEILRRQFLTFREDELKIPSEKLWAALPQITVGERCGRCGSVLSSVPRSTMALLACSKCGFVARRRLV